MEYRVFAVACVVFIAVLAMTLQNYPKGKATLP
jgi:hypothetical protein